MPKDVMNSSIERALQALEEGFYDPSFFEVEVALADSGFAGVADLDAFAEEVFREACERTGEVLRGLWETIGALPPPEVEVAIRKGYKLELEFSSPPYGSEPKLEVYVQNPKGAGREAFSLPAPRLSRLESFSLHAWGWWIEARVGLNLTSQMEPGLVVQKNRAFLQVYGVHRVRRFRESVKDLALLFDSLGLSDLEEALEGLEKLAEAKPITARTQGPYVLVRNGSLYALRRGSVFGDLPLDADFLAGREVKISAPFGVEISVKPFFALNRVAISKGLICWEGECKPLDTLAHNGCPAPNDPNLFTHLVQRGLSYNAVFSNPSHSLRMRALLEEIDDLGWREDLLAALRDEEFFRRVHLRALSSY
jgi:hypothetical protein